MGLILGLFAGLAGAVLRDPFSLVVLVASLAAGTLLRQPWWALVCAGAAFAAVYLSAGRDSGNIDLAGVGGVVAALMALAAFGLGRLARLAWLRFR